MCAHPEKQKAQRKKEKTEHQADVLQDRCRNRRDDPASAAGTGKKDTGTATDAASGKEKNNDWKQNRPIRLKFTFKEQREYETIDDDIAALEEKIVFIDDQMMKNATNSAKLAELMAQKEETEAALEEKTERWVYLTDLAERIEEQNQK